MVPNGENVFVISSSVTPFVKPPQYTVQLVGLLWLYTCQSDYDYVNNKMIARNLEKALYVIILSHNN